MKKRGFIWTLFSIFIWLIYHIDVESINIRHILAFFCQTYFKNFTQNLRYVNVNSGLAMMWQYTKKLEYWKATTQMRSSWSGIVLSFVKSHSFIWKNQKKIICEDPSIFALVYTLQSYTIQNNDRTQVSW